MQTSQQQQKMDHNNKLFAGFFISFDSSSQASLPAVKKEYEAILHVVKGNFFTEEQASLKEFQNNLDKVNLLHISTHSFLQGKENIPVLQLADGKFFLFELYGKTFQPQLIVLSACRTGHGMLAEGEGIISLARGFTATGAGGIVAGLWDMNDESTAELMGSFYKHLTKNKQPADALYAAKKEWLTQQQDQNFKKLPYFWAGLIYVGDDKPVNIEKKNAAAPIGWIAAALVAGILILIFFKGRKRKWPDKNGL
jgi:CHAT domain-containing protein